MLDFQRLDVYRCSIELVVLAVGLTDGAPRGNAALLDQLRRAASSIPRSIAEATGRTSEPDAARHFAIARGSAMECAAVLDVCRALGLVDEDRHRRGYELVERIVGMLTRLCR